MVLFVLVESDQRINPGPRNMDIPLFKQSFEIGSFEHEVFGFTFFLADDFVLFDAVDYIVERVVHNAGQKFVEGLLIGIKTHVCAYLLGDLRRHVGFVVFR